MYQILHQNKEIHKKVNACKRIGKQEFCQISALIKQHFQTEHRIGMKSKAFES